MAANILESLFVALGFQVDTTGLEDMKKKTEELRSSALQVGAVFTGAAAAIGLLVEGVASSLGDLYSFAELNEVSARSVAALGKIATENDGSLEGMKSTIQSLNKVIGEAALGVGRGAMTFQKLGLEAKNADGKVKTVDSLLGEVADKMQGLSRQEQIAMAEKLGIDPQFVKVLEKGSANLAKLREEAELLNPFTEEDYKLADEVDKLFIKAKGTLGVFTKMLGVALLPQVKEVLKSYMEWFKASRKATSDVFVRALKLIAGAVGTVWDWVVRLVSGLKSAFDWLTKFKAVTYLAAAAMAMFVSIKTYDFVTKLGSAIKLLTLRMATFNATALIIPAVIGAIILAFGLLIDDYVNWKEGNESVIGELASQFPQLLTVIQAVEQGVSAFVDFWLEQWDQVGGSVMELGSSLWQLVTTILPPVWEVVKAIFTGWGYLLAILIPPLARIAALIADVIVTALQIAIGFVKIFVDGLVAAVKTVFDISAGISNLIGKVGSALGLGNGNVQAAAGAAPGSGLQDKASANNSLNSAGGVIGSAGGTSNTSTVTQTTQISGVQITVSSPDPTKAGDAVKQELDKMNKQTVRNGQSAVAL